MNRTEITTEAIEQAVAEWFDAFGAHVAAEEFEQAGTMVAADVISFGTKANFVEGLDHLLERQWKGVWSTIEDFQFEEVRAQGTGSLAWGAAVWTSTGFDEDGVPYHRPGRATITLERRDGRWLAVHTHFSLSPETPQATFGPDGKPQ